MAWHKRSLQLIISLPLAFPMLSHAINVGETYIQSGQNEPLNASINVSDIDPKTFSVKIATPEMYKQLGLSADQAVSAKFQPTSSNGGKIILTSDQPVASPYADVVLNIENKGEKNLLPKTLLMPINGSQQLVTQPQTNNAIIKRPKIKKTIAKNAAIELPTATAVPTGTPLVINTGAPPDLAMTSTPDPVPNSALVTPPPTTGSSDTTATTPTNGKPTSSNLVIQETRRFSPVTNAAATSSAPDTPTTLAALTTTPPSEKKPDISIAKPTPVTTPITQTVPTKTTAGIVNDDDDDTTTYIIQRNDNLWTIASRIAKSNHKNVHQVMQDIIDENPEAFENGDPARMIANTELEIPNYETITSAAGIKAAKRNRTHAVAARAAPQRASAKKSPYKNTPAKAKYHGKKTSYRASHAAAIKPSIQRVNRPRPTPKARLNIISANQNNGNAQGNHQSTATGTHGTSSQLMDQVKQRREATANQASRVNQLNGALSSSEQKLKLQNEKLAMLEKRLKELNKS